MHANTVVQLVEAIYGEADAVVGYVSSPVRHFVRLIQFYCEKVVNGFGAARLEAFSPIVFCFKVLVVVSPRSFGSLSLFRVEAGNIMSQEGVWSV